MPKIKEKINRSYRIPGRTFFAFGPRGVGKSTWLKAKLQDALELNLLRTDLQLALTSRPHQLEDMIAGQKKEWVWIDEVQKVPRLLDEVHRLIEEKGYKFALSGSSARKLRKDGANLLGGRALTLNMEQFNFSELQEYYELEQALQFGLLPLVVAYPEEAIDTLKSYVFTYIREEIKEEGIVRKVEPFIRFLEVAGMLNGMQVNASNIARESSVPRASVDNYFSILTDTLLGHFLPAYTPQVKIKETVHPKFYWFDPGVARAAAGLLTEVVDSDFLGRSFETLIYHELRVYNEISKKFRPISFYRTQNQLEIDFIIELKKATRSSSSEIICIEVKNSRKWKTEWLQPIKTIRESGKLNVVKSFGVYCGVDRHLIEETEILPWKEFFVMLYEGRVF